MRQAVVQADRDGVLSANETVVDIAASDLMYVMCNFYLASIVSRTRTPHPAAGAPFASAHSFFQTGPFRPANLVRGIDNAVLAGGSTVPGVGVPTALLSGRLAAERVTGPAGAAGTRTITGSAKRVRT